MMVLNETPVRTAKNFRINNITLEDISFQKCNFNGLQINSSMSSVEIEKLDNNSINFEHSVGLDNILNENLNSGTKIVVKETTNNTIFFNYVLDEKNKFLYNNLEICVNENVKANMIIKFSNEGRIKTLNNSYINVTLKNGSNLNLTVMNFLNENADNFISMQNTILENANLDYTLIEFGGKNSVTSYYSNCKEDNSKNNLNCIYVGNNEKLLDLNYILSMNGKYSKANMEVYGALKDNARKSFKGTLDFKKGAKKAIGNENEFCYLLSDTSRSLSLPMLLCAEEDVEGNHSSASGKADEKQLFYLMSRGFSKSNKFNCKSKV